MVINWGKVFNLPIAKIIALTRSAPERRRPQHLKQRHEVMLNIVHANGIIIHRRANTPAYGVFAIDVVHVNFSTKLELHQAANPSANASSVLTGALLIASLNG